MLSPSPSTDPLPSNATATPAVPLYGPPARAVGGAFEPPTVTTVASLPEPPSLSVTVTRTVSVPGSRYVWLALIAVLWLDADPLAGAEPSPQAIVYDPGPSAAPGSVKVALTTKDVRGLAVRSGPAFTLGGTLVTVAVVVAGSLAAPCESVTVRLTAYVPLSP